MLLCPECQMGQSGNKEGVWPLAEAVDTVESKACIACRDASVPNMHTGRRTAVEAGFRVQGLFREWEYACWLTLHAGAYTCTY